MKTVKRTKLLHLEGVPLDWRDVHDIWIKYEESDPRTPFYVKPLINEIPPNIPQKKETWPEWARHVLSAQTFSKIYSFITP